jgi:hypothetical protein
VRMLSFKDYSKVLLRLSRVTDELHDIDKMTGGEFSKMDRKDSSADLTPIGSSDSETHGTKDD